MVTEYVIKVDTKIRELLDKNKEHPRETYNDVLSKLLLNKESKKKRIFA